jgi:hypothetical protein
MSIGIRNNQKYIWIFDFYQPQFVYTTTHFPRNKRIFVPLIKLMDSCDLHQLLRWIGKSSANDKKQVHFINNLRRSLKLTLRIDLKFCQRSDGMKKSEIKSSHVIVESLSLSLASFTQLTCKAHKKLWLDSRWIELVIKAESPNPTSAYGTREVACELPVNKNWRNWNLFPLS